MKISVNATDSGSGIKEVILQYSLNNGASWTNVNMTYNSTSNLYERIIPVQSTNLTVKYAVYASDNVGNGAVNNNSGQYYSYYVIPEFLLVMLIAILVLSSLPVAILNRKHNKKTH
ncbi:hypothetical protein KEJ45_00965 [Candidatus Bathyarchaeota archaeon]|nr:hypothetical protein [Candidatus Bathyarchaeota archaeon]